MRGRRVVATRRPGAVDAGPGAGARLPRPGLAAVRGVPRRGGTMGGAARPPERPEPVADSAGRAAGPGAVERRPERARGSRVRVSQRSDSFRGEAVPWAARQAHPGAGSRSQTPRAGRSAPRRSHEAGSGPGASSARPGSAGGRRRGGGGSSRAVETVKAGRGGRRGRAAGADAVVGNVFFGPGPGAFARRPELSEAFSDRVGATGAAGSGSDGVEGPARGRGRARGENRGMGARWGP